MSVTVVNGSGSLHLVKGLVIRRDIHVKPEKLYLVLHIMAFKVYELRGFFGKF